SCSSLSSSSISASGDIKSTTKFFSQTGTSASPSYSFNGATTSGMYLGTGNLLNLTADTTSLQIAPSTSGAGIFTNAGLFSGGIINSGTFGITCGALSSGAITSSGTISNGTNSMTCGALSCSSISSTGAITQPRYYTVVTFPGGNSQTINYNNFTDVTWSSAITSSNFSTSFPATTLTIPINGLYH